MLFFCQCRVVETESVAWQVVLLLPLLCKYVCVCVFVLCVLVAVRNLHDIVPQLHLG